MGTITKTCIERSPGPCSESAATIGRNSIQNYKRAHSVYIRGLQGTSENNSPIIPIQNAGKLFGACGRDLTVIYQNKMLPAMDSLIGGFLHPMVLKGGLDLDWKGAETCCTRRLGKPRSKPMASQTTSLGERDGCATEVGPPTARQVSLSWSAQANYCGENRWIFLSTSFS